MNSSLVFLALGLVVFAAAAHFPMEDEGIYGQLLGFHRLRREDPKDVPFRECGKKLVEKFIAIASEIDCGDSLEPVKRSVPLRFKRSPIEGKISPACCAGKCTVRLIEDTICDRRQ